jgi:hypothetical protein
MHGQGTLYEKGGSSFEGCWENGRREGVITESRRDGEVCKGEWAFGKFIREVDEAKKGKKNRKERRESGTEGSSR